MDSDTEVVINEASETKDAEQAGVVIPVIRSQILQRISQECQSDTSLDIPFLKIA